MSKKKEKKMKNRLFSFRFRNYFNKDERSLQSSVIKAFLTFFLQQTSKAVR